MGSDGNVGKVLRAHDAFYFLLFMVFVLYWMNILLSYIWYPFFFVCFLAVLNHFADPSYVFSECSITLAYIIVGP